MSHIIYILAMLIDGVLGVFINAYLFWNFLKKDRNGGFLTYCLAKTVSNLIVCGAFLFWVVPITSLSLSYQEIPRIINALVGQSAGFGAYVAGALIELFMAADRCSVIFNPSFNFKMANRVIIFVFIAASIYTFMGIIPASCAFVFDPEIFIWRPEESICASFMESLILYTIYGTFVFSNTFNFITFAKLCLGRVDGITTSEMMRRRRRRIKFFIQSFIQNCLHMLDMLNFNFISNLYDATWFKFIFNSMSLLTIHMLDGFVMLMFQPNAQPRSKRNSSAVMTI